MKSNRNSTDSITTRCPALFTSKKKDYETPQDLFDALNEVFHFTTDVCATAENTKCANFYSPTEDGLVQTWTGNCWMNPPYGKMIIDKWVEKALASTKNGTTTVCLLPARTDPAWWHDYVSKATHIEMLKGRLRFGGGKNQAPFPSVIVVFAPAGTQLPLLMEPGKPISRSILNGKFRGRGLVVAPVKMRHRYPLSSGNRDILYPEGSFVEVVGDEQSD